MSATSLPQLTVVGWRDCPFHQQALEAARALTQGGHFVTLDERTFATRDAFRTWLFGEEGRVNFEGEAQSHSSSPFVWIDDKHYLGGCDALLELAAELEGASAMEITAEPRAELKMCIENFWNTLPKSGTYFTGTERVMIAHEVRAATWQL